MDKIIAPEDIKAHIFKIRGQHIMLDADLAQLYGVPVYRLNEAVRRNIKRFPIDFLFKLTRFEWSNLISQFAISSLGHGGRRHPPIAFTEQGVAMVSSVLNSDKAIQVNIAIIRAFVKLRHALAHDRGLSHRVEKIEGKLNLLETDIRRILVDVNELKKHPMSEGPRPPIDPRIV